MVAGIAQIVNRVEQRAVQIKDNGHRLLLFTGFCLQRYEKKRTYANLCAQKMNLPAFCVSAMCWYTTAVIVA